MKIGKATVFIVILAAGLIVLFPLDAKAGDEVVVGKKWAQSGLVSMDRIDHRGWDALLRKHVDDRGMVDYRAWKASADDQRALDAYLAELSRASRRAPAEKAARLAFWINAYNAVTIRGVLREYPTDSIRNHTPKLLGYNIWDDLLLQVGGEQFSLNQMEHEILRKMGEPRIHFAIVCASVGCPRLLTTAYTAENLEQAISVNTKAFFADRSKAHADVASRTIHLSPILKWFGADFGSTEAERLRTIAPYFPDEAAQRLAASGNARVLYLEYDWGLNDQAKHPAAAWRR